MVIGLVSGHEVRSSAKGGRMEHGMSLEVLVVLSASLVIWGIVSGWFERWNVTAPMVFLAVGFLVANEPLSLIEVEIGGDGLRELAEITLAVVLFGDAARVRVRELFADAALPGRLLGIGLPLTMVLGTVGAKLLFPDLSWWVCAVIGTAVAPTDAALGAAIIDDERVPQRIRRVLNVESGLNDGIATPFVSFFIVAAATGVALQGESRGDALIDLAIGVGAGVALGAGAGWLMARSSDVDETARAVGVAGLAVLSFAATVALGGNGFVAAFVAGLAFGATVPAAQRTPSLELTHLGGSVLSQAVWFLVGAVMAPELARVSWREIVFVVVALTLARMVPVAIAVAGMGLDRATVGVLGWFGPRGLASVVFALLAFGQLGSADGERVVTAITAVVVGSVLLHGASAGPVAARYGASHQNTG
jgi:NhaP-type Na+/H+ or K+/H+ antiporter